MVGGVNHLIQPRPLSVAPLACLLMRANRLAEVPYPRVEAMQAMLDFLQPQNSGVAKVRAEDMVDASLVAELERSGFIDSLSR